MEFSLPRTLLVLERTPATLQALLSDLPAVWTEGNEGNGTWSPYDVVGHLNDGEEADWMARARIILARGMDRRFTPFDRSRHFQRRAETLEERLECFAKLRRANLDELRGWNLAPDQLALTGEHPEFGTVTLQQLLATWAVHDLGHLAQIARVMAKQYQDEVGPWEAYLPVLHR